MSNASEGNPEEGFGRFFLPGPTEVHPDVLEAQARPMIGHRGPAIEELMGRIQDGLRMLFRTERYVLVSTSSATGLMEAAIRNGVRDRVLSLVNGAFSGRFANIAESCGKDVDRLEVPWGEVHDPEQVRKKLQSGDYDAVTLVHSETSTGARNRVPEIAEVVREFDDVLVLVDSVSGLGGADVRTDEWGLDFVLTGTQKAVAVPPGLAFAAPSERLMERSKSLPDRGTYFDLQKFQAKIEKNQTPNTPAVSLLYALDVQLQRIRSEGLDARQERHLQMARRCWEWVDGLREDRGVDVRCFVEDPDHRSPTVTCVLLPDGLSGKNVVSTMKEKGWVIGGGYGKMKEGAFRIGHMGEQTLDTLNGLLAELEETLVELNATRTTTQTTHA
ncbi:MAG: alanine--glyoxylate aminotransferase family protein [Longimicrobiales bacterium]|nr:alanine--glyoxylate aminotransferase family protein [Longimicrobiales bacterium]